MVGGPLTGYFRLINGNTLSNNQETVHRALLDTVAMKHKQ